MAHAASISTPLEIGSRILLQDARGSFPGGDTPFRTKGGLHLLRTLGPYPERHGDGHDSIRTLPCSCCRSWIVACARSTPPLSSEGCVTGSSVHPESERGGEATGSSERPQPTVLSAAASTPRARREPSRSPLSRSARISHTCASVDHRRRNADTPTKSRIAHLNTLLIVQRRTPCGCRWNTDRHAESVRCYRATADIERAICPGFDTVGR